MKSIEALHQVMKIQARKLQESQKKLTEKSKQQPNASILAELERCNFLQILINELVKDLKTEVEGDWEQ